MMIGRYISALGLVCSMLITTPVLANPTQNNTVQIKGAFDFKSLDPTRSGYIYTRMQLLETLLDVDEQGQLKPALASDWAISENRTQWDLTIRDNVTFHDGTPLNAAVVVDDLNRIRQRPSELQRAPVESITLTDSNQVRITLTQPYRLLGAVLAHYSAALLSPTAYNEQGEVIKLIGTGPFSLYDVDIPHQLIVQRYDQYWGQKAHIEYASYLTGHRAEARVLQARSGQADIVFGLDPASVPMLKRLPHLQIVRSELPRTLVLKLNAGHPLLAEADIRNALSLAINRTGIAKAILHTPEAATTQLLPSSMQDWHLPEQSIEYDLTKATELLASHGWKKDSRGLLSKDGQPFKLTLITYADRPELTTIATAIQDQWKQLGVQLDINITNSSGIPSGHQDGSLEVALIARNYGAIADPLGVLMKDFGQPGGGDWGSMNWANPDVQSLLNTLISETNTDNYREKAQQIAQSIHDEKPVIAVAAYVQQTALNKRIDGFHFDPFERSYYLNELTWR